MRAALSDSRSKDVGQKASEPSLWASLLVGGPSLSTRVQALSKPALEVVFVWDQVGRADWMVEVMEERAVIV